MNARAYYNENDKYCAAWLRNLIGANLIAPGDVDERSIVDVRADDLAGYEQCHFFAGIGGWSYALRLAGWDDARPVWTGSCPCQPFSAAGERTGFSDARDLWPAWFELIRERAPAILFGEQVASATIWLDRVFADLEDQSYAVAAAILPACAVDAPHRRDRLWFVGNTTSAARERNAGSISGTEAKERSKDWPQHGDRAVRPTDASEGADATLADADRGDGFWWSGPLQVGRNALAGKVTAGGDFSGTQWRIKPGVPLLADGIPNRVAKLCALDNAIVPQVAAEFIAAAREAIEATP